MLGITGILQHPSVLQALNPWYAATFLWQQGFTGFMVLAAVVLVVTGGEALYADMGHFGPRPIRVAWYAVVLPALVLNYFGQGAHAARESRRRPEIRSTPWCRAGRSTRWW